MLVLNEKVYSICDVWPLSNSYKKFFVYVSYLFVHLVIMNMNLYDVMGNLEQTVENIIDNTIATTTFLMMFQLRFSKMIRNVVAIVKKELAEDDFQNTNELNLYLSYNKISHTFGKYAIRGSITTWTWWYLSPMINLLKSGSGISVIIL